MTTEADKQEPKFAQTAPEPGIAAELLAFLVHKKKLWLLPLVLLLGLIGLLIALGGTAAAPFIYTLF
jgi:hypothetical protein